MCEMCEMPENLTPVLRAPRPLPLTQSSSRRPPPFYHISTVDEQGSFLTTHFPIFPPASEKSLWKSSRRLGTKRSNVFRLQMDPKPLGTLDRGTQLSKLLPKKFSAVWNDPKAYASLRDLGGCPPRPIRNETQRLVDNKMVTTRQGIENPNKSHLGDRHPRVGYRAKRPPRWATTTRIHTYHQLLLVPH